MYAREETVDHYTRVMSEWRQNGAETNYQIASFFMRLLEGLSASDLVLRVSVIGACQQILQQMGPGERMQHKELYCFCRHVAKAFLLKVKEDPVFCIEAMLSLSCRGLGYSGHARLSGEESRAEDEAEADGLGDKGNVSHGGRLSELDSAVLWSDRVRMLARWIVEEELSSELNWLMSTLEQAIAGGLECQITADSRTRKLALGSVLFGKLLEDLGLRFVEERWTVTQEIILDKSLLERLAVLKEAKGLEEADMGESRVSKSVTCEADSASDGSDATPEAAETETETVDNDESMEQVAGDTAARWAAFKNSNMFLSNPTLSATDSAQGRAPLVITSDSE